LNFSHENLPPDPLIPGCDAIIVVVIDIVCVTLIYLSKTNLHGSWEAQVITLSERIFNAGCLLLLTAAIALTGCAQSDNIAAAVQQPPPADQGDPFIVYQRSGGLNSLDDVLCIYNGGGCELARKNGRIYRCQVISMKLCKLEQAFEQSGFFALPDQYPGNSQADAIRYSISYAANGQKHRVTAYSDSMPDSLQPLVRELDQCIMLVSTTIPR